MILKGDRCTLRPWRAADARRSCGTPTTSNVARHLRDRFPHPYTLEGRHGVSVGRRQGTAADQLRDRGRWRGSRRPGLRSGPRRRTLLRRGRLLAGRGVLGPRHRHRGADAVYRHAFAELGLLRLFALPLADNIGSSAGARKGWLRRRRAAAFELREVRQAARPGDLRRRQRSVVALRRCLQPSG